MTFNNKAAGLNFAHLRRHELQICLESSV